MLILHAIWSARSSLCLWGEDSEALIRRSRAPARRKSGRAAAPRRRAEPALRPHPFAAEPERITDAIGITVDGGAPGEVVLRLPSGPRAPNASPTLEHLSPRDRRAATRLAPWRVPVVEMPPGAALDALLALAETPARGFVTGESLHALARAADLALELVAQGRVLPGIIDGEPPIARWLPAPGPEQAERLRALAAALPPLCRAEMIDGSPQGREPGAILLDAVAALADAAVRSSLAGRRLSRSTRKPASGAEAFVAALTAEDPALRAEPDEIRKLERVLSEWHRSGLSPAGPVRTCFRLTAPEAPEAPWRVEFLLQSTEDPSLLVPAARVWEARRALTVLKRTIDQPQERLLADLGRATRLYPDLEAALDAPRPAELQLDSAGAHRFLREAVPLLDQAGFGILVPPWWRSRGARLGLRLKARSKQTQASSSGILGLEGLCDYRYEVALGDRSLSARELREMARLKEPLVRVRGQWVELRPDDIEAALGLLKASPAEPMTAVDVLRIGLGLMPSASGLPIVDVEADGWLGELLATDRKLEPVPAPPEFRGTLRPYQERGLAWLSFLDDLGLGGCLADDMGLGKTPQLLALLLARPNGRKGGRRPTLVVCPMSVVGNWQREAERFAPSLAVHVHHGSGRRGGSEFKKSVARADLVLTTYNLAARDRDLLAGIRWERIVLDEAQAIKNPEAKQTQAVRALSSPRRFVLTGTPVENRLSELWSIMEFLNPGLLGSARGFRERFAVPVERYRDADAAELLKRITGPFILRRLKTDRSIITDLPDKIEMKVFCNLTKEQATLYQAVLDDMMARIAASTGIERRGLVLAAMMKLKQTCNHPAHLLGDGSRLDGRSGKLARLEEILEEALAEGDRALCFTQFAEMGFLLQRHLQERLSCEVPFLHGGVSKRARDEMVAWFQSETGPGVLLLSLKAGGVGLNLTGANHVVHFDRWWNPAVEDQATDRAFRIGQRRDVQVRKFVCVGTLEERIDRMIEEKRDLADRIVGTGEAWLTELSTAELRELLALSTDAVAEG